MRSSLWTLIAFGMLASSAHAHPPYSLVMDNHGAVYYSDLTNVWRITPDGQRKIAVPNVHTHELWIDAEGAVYGEDVTNVGETYRHRVWRLSPNGVLTNALPWRDGHPSDLEDVVMSRGAEGREYVLRRAANRIVLLENSKTISTLDLSTIGATPDRIHVSPSGTLYLTAGSSLWRWETSAPTPERLATDLIERTEPFSFIRDHHALMGVWGGDQGVYVAVFSGQHVNRIASDGSQTVAVRSIGEWSPVSGLIAPDGAMWIQEFSTSNQTRIRRIAPDGTETLLGSATPVRPPASSTPHPVRLPFMLVTAGILTVLTLALYSRFRMQPQRS